jgi:hypothetical protein
VYEVEEDGHTVLRCGGCPDRIKTASPPPNDGDRFVWKAGDVRILPNDETHAKAGGEMTALVEMFNEWDLPAPPIPTRFQASLQEVGPHFATSDVTPLAMYLFETELPLQLLQGRLEDFVAVSFAGHGVNSYALSYFLVDGPLALFLQTHWGGVYTDVEMAASAWRLLVSHVERLLQAAQARPAVDARDPAERLLVVNSDFRGSGTWAFLRAPLAEDAARALLQRQPSEVSVDLSQRGQQALIAATSWAESAWLP